MFQNISGRMANLVKPTIDAMCRVNGLICNVYEKQPKETVTPITGRGETLGSNNLAFTNLPKYPQVRLLIANPVRKGYKGANINNSTSGTNTVDSITETMPYIETYQYQYGIDWKPMMKVEVFYTDLNFPQVVYQTTEILEEPLAKKSIMHSGIIHVLLAPFM